MPPSLSVPHIDAQACDAEKKKAEITCKGSTACGQSTASSRINSGDNKTVAMRTLKTCVVKLFSHTENWLIIIKGMHKESDG